MFSTNTPLLVSSLSFETRRRWRMLRGYCLVPNFSTSYSHIGDSWPGSAPAATPSMSCAPAFVFPTILCRLSPLWSAERRYQCLFNSSSSLPSVNVTPPNSSPPRFGNKRKMKSASRTDSRTQSLDVIFPRRRIVPRVRLIATPFPVHTSFSPDSRQVGMNHE